jgi:hypothetical protein
MPQPLLTRIKREHRRIERTRTKKSQAPATYHRARRKNVQACKAIAKLAEWLASKGWDLVINNRVRNVADFNETTVTINGRSGPQAQLAFLAHECGHIVVDSRRTSTDRFSRGWPLAVGPKKNKNTIHRVSLVEEEIEAWAVGERLLKKMNIPYDKNTFLVCKSGALRTYFRWAGRKKHREPVSG